MDGRAPDMNHTGVDLPCNLVRPVRILGENGSGETICVEVTPSQRQSIMGRAQPERRAGDANAHSWSLA